MEGKKKYMKIIHYMSGPSIWSQIEEIEDMGMMDKDTRLFFAKNNSLTMGDVAELLHAFDAEIDSDFNDGNVVFKPKEWYINDLNGRA